MSERWSSTSDEGHGDAWRWNPAELEAERNPSPDLRAMFHRFVLLEVPGLLLLGVGLAVGAVILWGGDGPEADLWLAARWGLLAAVAGVLGFGMVHFVRSAPLASNVLSVLTPGQRKHVQRQLRGGVTVMPRELTVVRAAARERRAAILRQFFTLTPIGLLPVVQLASRRNETITVVFESVLMVVVAAVVVMGWWQYRRASAFLRTHPALIRSDIDESGE